MSLKRVFVIMGCFYLSHALDIMLASTIWIFLSLASWQFLFVWYLFLFLDVRLFFLFFSFIFEFNNFACNFFEKNMTNEIFLLVPFIYASSFWLMLMAVLKFLSFFFFFFLFRMMLSQSVSQDQHKFCLNSSSACKVPKLLNL